MLSDASYHLLKFANASEQQIYFAAQFCLSGESWILIIQQFTLKLIIIP